MDTRVDAPPPPCVSSYSWRWTSSRRCPRRRENLHSFTSHTSATETLETAARAPPRRYPCSTSHHVPAAPPANGYTHEPRVSRVVLTNLVSLTRVHPPDTGAVARLRVARARSRRGAKPHPPLKFEALHAKKAHVLHLCKNWKNSIVHEERTKRTRPLPCSDERRRSPPRRSRWR